MADHPTPVLPLVDHRIHAGHLSNYPFEYATRQSMSDNLAIRYAEPPWHVASCMDDPVVGLHISR